MKLIGLTGTTGSGKGYVAALFAREGIPSIDTDAIVHRLYRENAACIAELEAAFGALRGEDGAIDRKKLASIVFSDREKLLTLNSIVHRYVAQEVEILCRAEEKRGGKLLLLDAPQLYEAGMEKLCHCVVAVTAPANTRMERICERDHIPPEAAERRMASQHTDAFFEARADYVIRNDGNLPVMQAVKRIAGELKYDKKEAE